jgi:transketolase
VLRPADSHETVEAWRLALARAEAGPTALVLSRQALPVLSPPAAETGGWMAERGARVVGDVGGSPAVAIVATGSEVGLAIEGARVLATEHGVAARVLSMPWRERFCGLPPADQDALLPPGIPRLVVEAASPQGWEGVAGATGRVLGLGRFGASAPGARVMAELGFTPERIAKAALEVIGKGASDAR